MKKAKLSKSDYLVKLNEIPHQGETFEFSKTSIDISPFLEDLTGGGDYKAVLTIIPMGNVYQVRGTVKSSLLLDCSRCGQESKESCDEVVNEILMVQTKSQPRNAKEGRSHESDHNEGPFCNFISKPQLHAADFIREIIACSTPYLSYCGKPNCHKTLENATKSNLAAEPTNTNPFTQLEGIKEKLRPN